MSEPSGNPTTGEESAPSRKRPIALASAILFLDLCAWVFLRGQIPYNTAPELRPLLRNASSVIKRVDRLTVASPAGKFSVKSCPTLSYELPEPFDEFSRSAASRLKADDGWRLMTETSRADPASRVLTAIKADRPHSVMVEMHAWGGTGGTSVNLRVMAPPLGPIREWIWHNFHVF